MIIHEFSVALTTLITAEEVPFCVAVRLYSLKGKKGTITGRAQVRHGDRKTRATALAIYIVSLVRPSES